MYITDMQAHTDSREHLSYLFTIYRLQEQMLH